MSIDIEIHLVARNDRYDEEDPRWLDQVSALKNELHRETESVRHRREPVPRTKVTVDQFVLTLGTAGVFSVAVDILRVWLARDKDRSVQFTVIGPDGERETVQVTAENAGDAAWDSIIKAVPEFTRERQ